MIHGGGEGEFRGTEIEALLQAMAVVVTMIVIMAVVMTVVVIMTAAESGRGAHMAAEFDELPSLNRLSGCRHGFRFR